MEDVQSPHKDEKLAFIEGTWQRFLVASTSRFALVSQTDDIRWVTIRKRGSSTELNQHRLEIEDPCPYILVTRWQA
jgi:hypothetical protein